MTTPERWQKLKPILDHALALDAANVAAWLDEACADDPALRADVESLLAYRDTDAEFLERPAFDVLGAERPGALVGATLGRYTVARRLGVGGMGEVYLAEQRGPLERTVAIKRIRPGMDTGRFLARFDLERALLARMNHPNVAQVFDAGSTPDGAPYVVMEYVDGMPVTVFCDEQTLPLRDRIALLATACNGVAHAHQKGIIHGDLKPGNVLVTVRDDEAVPKIIDFGVARLAHCVEDTGPDSPADVKVTRQRFGSPAYASPEQLTGSADIDTRSDVYALGALLADLIAGPASEPRTALDARITADVATRRGHTTESLRAALAGDLAWTVAKAQARDPDDRYSTVSELRTDLDRYLRDEPTLAAGDRPWYRLKKFLRRHTAGVAAASLVLVAVCAAMVITTMAWLRAVEAERLASREAAATRQVSQFLVDLFRVSDPREARGREVTAREVIDNGLRRLDYGLDQAPEVEAALLDTIGTAYMQLGLFDEARPLLEKGRGLRHEALGEHHPDYGDSLRSLGLLAFHTGEFAEAEAHHRAALAVNRAVFGERHERVAANWHNIASAVDQQGRWDEAETLLRDALALLGGDAVESEPVARTLNNLAGVLRRQGRPQEALVAYDRALVVRRAIGHDPHPDTAIVLNNLGVTHTDLGALAEATRYHDQAVSMQRALLGDRHPAVLTSLTNLASVLVRQRRFDEAVARLHESAGLHRDVLGATHLNTAQTLNNLGTALYRRQDVAESIDVFRQAIDAFAGSVGIGHPLGALARLNLANALLVSDRTAEARPLADAAREDLASAGLPATHPLVVLGNATAGTVLAAERRFAEAEPLLLDSLAAMEKAFGPRSDRVVELLDRLTRLYADWDKPARSAEFAARLAAATAKEPPG